MPSFVDIERETVPAWHELRVTRRGIAVDLHPLAFRNAVEVFGNGYFASQTHTIFSEEENKEYPLPPFINPTDSRTPWGFGGNAKPIRPNHSGWASFVVPWPVYDEPFDLLKLFHSSATLEAICLPLRYPEYRTDFQKPQLLVLSGISKDNWWYYAGGLEAKVSPPFRRWLATKGNAEFPRVEQVMYEAWMKIDWQKRHPKFFRREFHCTTGLNGVLRLGVPGSCACL